MFMNMWLFSLYKLQVSKDICQSQEQAIITCDINYAYLLVTIAQQ